MKKLTKRTYLGVGAVHVLRNNETGEELVIPCTLEEYARLGEKGGSQFNPVREGYTYVYSFAGQPKVDTPTTLLGENEYCEKDGELIVSMANEHHRVAREKVDKQGNFDEREVIKEERVWQ